MADTNVKIVLSAQDTTGPAFSSVSSKMKGLNTDVSGLAKTMMGGVIAGGVALTAFLYSSVKAAGEAQVALANVDATLKAMGSSAVANRSAILDAAQATQSLGYDAEDSAKSITRFYQATGDLNDALNLNNIAMDLAAAKNIDLSTAASLVNQVLSGNGRVLKQYQIDIKDTATPLEALGQLHEQVMGQALAKSQTFEGQMKVISLAFEDFKKTIGLVLIDALMPFINQFTAWLNNPVTQKNFKKWTADFQSWAEVIIPVVIGVFQLWWNVLKGIYDTIIKIGDEISKLITKASNLTNTVGSAWANAGSNIKWAITGKASGGPVSPSQSYMVGEQGPEMFRPKSAGDIIPAYALARGGSTTIVNITGNMLLDDSAAEKIGDLIIDRLKLSARLT
jgi:hypothetical protein